jgi:membrane-associated phospholipid phosphatase
MLATLLAMGAHAAPAPADALFGSNVQKMPVAEMAGVGAIGVAALAVELFVHPPDTARWRGPILFDGAARDALGGGSPGLRSAAASGSDVGEVGFVAWPVLLDAGIVTWLSRGRGDVARQLLYIDAEAFALNGLLSSIVQRSVGRERPFAQGCGTSAGAPCTSPDDRNTSFFSGHTSFAFTGAALVCAQHSRLDLYGSADAFVCPVALVLASATGILRIVADRHWASDVLAGAAVGATVGTVVSLSHISAGKGADSTGGPPPAGFAIRF